MPDSVTFINHATVLIQLNGCALLTDPVYSFSVSYFLPRLKKPGIPFHQLPHIDVVLISHNHYDHLNLRTLRRLRRAFDPAIIVPQGVGNYAKRAAFRQIGELRWWQELISENVKITCVPAKHRSGRRLFDRNKSGYCGYIIESKGKVVYFAGDTAYDGFFSELGSKFSIDVALLPIGAYKPYEWFKNIHLNPRTAIRAFTDLKARHLVPIHWGTFKISDEPMAEPPAWIHEEAVKEGIADRVHILNNGESFSL